MVTMLHNMRFMIVVFALFACACTGQVKANQEGSTSTKPEAPAIRTHFKLASVFSSVAEFAELEFPSYEKDSNIELIPIANSGYTWLIDRTPGLNYAWYLLHEVNSGQVRVVFYTPGAAEVNLDAKKEYPPITTTIPALHSFPQKTAIFSFMPELNYYVPSQCNEQTPQGTKVVSCDQWYETE